MSKNEKGASEVVIGLGLFVGVIALGMAVWAGSVLLAPLFGAGNAFKQTETADFRIANYEVFKRDCNAILSTEGKIAIQQDAVESATPTSKPLAEQNLNALKMLRAEQINDYNAKSSMSQTRAKFKDAALPVNINPNSEIGSFTCPAS